MPCPRCDSLLIAPRPSASLLDRLLSLAFIRPVQCQLCKHRFRTIQWDTLDIPSAAERRKIFRVPVRVPVSFESREASGKGTVTDISAGGCALDSKRFLRPELLLRLHFPTGMDETNGNDAQQLGLVRGVSGSRAGLQFVVCTPQDQVQLAQTITTAVTEFRKK